MNVDIKTTNDNKLFERKEVTAEVTFDTATPKRGDIKQSICGKLGADPDTVVLRRVSSMFGLRTVKVFVHIYSNKAKLMKTEPKHIKIREGFMQKQEKKKKEVKKAPKKK